MKKLISIGILIYSEQHLNLSLVPVKETLRLYLKDVSEYETIEPILNIYKICKKDKINIKSKYEKNYGKLCTLIYDLDKPLAKHDELDLYTNEITNKDAAILEPMCGSGRFYIPLLQKGYNITGFDLSEDMLNASKKKCNELALKPKIFQSDISTF